MGDFRQHRGLIAGAGAHLQDLVPGLERRPLGHQGHDIRLRNGLAGADGQGMVLIGQGGQKLRHEAVPMNLPHGRQHPDIGDVPALELLGHHALPGRIKPFRGLGCQNPRKSQEGYA